MLILDGNSTKKEFLCYNILGLLVSAFFAAMKGSGLANGVIAAPVNAEER